MSIEWFSKLKEYDSLSKMRINHLKNLSEQDSRLLKLEERRKIGQNALLELKQSYISLQQSLHDLEKKIKTATEQMTRLQDAGGDDTKIAQFKNDASIAEDQAFTLLEEMDKNESERSDQETFLKGLEKTILEISQEVKEEKAKQNLEIERLDLRLSSVKDELPENFKNLLLKTLSKNLAHGPFTRTDQGTCFFCRFKISKLDESEIDMQKALKVCPQCSRIFIPFGT